MSTLAETALAASRIRDENLVRSVLEEIAADLTRILDRRVRVWECRAWCVKKRPAGRESAHVSFRIVVRDGRDERHGAILVPLPDAVTLGLSLLMAGNHELREGRRWTRLDRSTKKALLEVGRFLAGSVDGVMRRGSPGCSVGFAGCQGVPPDVRPAFPYVEGHLLRVGISRAQIDTFPAFELIAILPVGPD